MFLLSREPKSHTKVSQHVVFYFCCLLKTFFNWVKIKPTRCLACTYECFPRPICITFSHEKTQVEAYKIPRIFENLRHVLQFDPLRFRTRNILRKNLESFSRLLKIIFCTLCSQIGYWNFWMTEHWRIWAENLRFFLFFLVLRKLTRKNCVVFWKRNIFILNDGFFSTCFIYASKSQVIIWLK